MSRGITRPELLATVVGVVGAGIVTLALLSARSTSSHDAAAVPPDAPAQEPSSAPFAQLASASSIGWSSANDGYWTGNQRKSVAFELPAENKVEIWMRHVRPTLVVRCLSRRTEVFVFTDSAARIEPNTEDHTVRIGFDDEAELTERWPDSADHDALFAPDGAAFARRLSAARTMRFGFTPHNAPPAIVHFNVSGLAELIAPAAKECGWKP